MTDTLFSAGIIALHVWPLVLFPLLAYVGYRRRYRSFYSGASLSAKAWTCAWLVFQASILGLLATVIVFATLGVPTVLLFLSTFVGSFVIVFIARIRSGVPLYIFSFSDGREPLFPSRSAEFLYDAARNHYADEQPDDVVSAETDPKVRSQLLTSYVMAKQRNRWVPFRIAENWEVIDHDVLFAKGPFRTVVLVLIWSLVIGVTLAGLLHSFQLMVFAPTLLGLLSTVLGPVAFLPFGISERLTGLVAIVVVLAAVGFVFHDGKNPVLGRVLVTLAVWLYVYFSYQMAPVNAQLMALTPGAETLKLFQQLNEIPLLRGLATGLADRATGGAYSALRSMVETFRQLSPAYYLGASMAILVPMAVKLTLHIWFSEESRVIWNREMRVPPEIGRL